MSLTDTTEGVVSSLYFSFLSPSLTGAGDVSVLLSGKIITEQQDSKPVVSDKQHHHHHHHNHLHLQVHCCPPGDGLSVV